MAHVLKISSYIHKTLIMKKIIASIILSAAGIAVFAQTPGMTPQGTQPASTSGTGTTQQGTPTPGSQTVQPAPAQPAIPSTVQPGIDGTNGTTQPGRQTPGGVLQPGPVTPVNPQPGARTPGTNQPGSVTSPEQAPVNDRTSVNINKLPSGVSGSLSGREYSGWDVSEAFRISGKGNNYEIKLKRNGETKTVRMDENGKAIK